MGCPRIADGYKKGCKIGFGASDRKRKPCESGSHPTIGGVNEDRTVSAGALLPNLLWDIREHLDDREGNILFTYAQQVAELVGYLEVTAQDYEAASQSVHRRQRAASQAD